MSSPHFTPVHALAAILFLAFAQSALTQAPGDFQAQCESQASIYRADWKVLLDSHRYEGLTTLWEVVDFDGDQGSFSQISGICDRGFFACNGFPQNNWIFTQLIHTLSAREIFFNVTINDCFQEPCTDFLSLHVNNSKIDSSSRTDPAKYERLTDTTKPLSTNTILSSTQPEGTSFYFGIQDTGICGIIGRILVYYRVCLGRQTGLVVYPEKPLPPGNEPVEYFDASCVDNAHNVTSLQVRANGAEGTCDDVASNGAICECNRGYSDQNGVCVACQPGTYGTGGRCLNCPQNSNSIAPGAKVCECLPGSFRSSQETANQSCTVPPEPVTNLRELSALNTSITLSWNRPDVVGRPDFYYNISISDPANFGLLIVVDNQFQTDSEVVSFTISNLQPATSYEVRVSTHNGVSGQDPENNGRRVASTIVRTQDGVPGIPQLNRFCNVILWRQPNVTGGRLTGYDLMIGSTLIHLDSTENFYITSAAQKQANVLVQIRAHNSAFSSPFSQPQTIGCEDQLGCPQVINTAKPSAATEESPSSTSTTPTITSTRLPASTSSPTTSTTPPPSTVAPTASFLCPELMAPLNGRVLTSGAAATYSCNEGFTLQGNTQRMCSANGWNGSAPTCTKICELSRPHFVLNGIVYQNNSQITLQDVREGTQALMCRTTSPNCCQVQRIGEFYYPDNSTVGINADREGLYRNRRGSNVILNRRQDTTGPVGQYRCEILDECGEKVSLYVLLV